MGERLTEWARGVIPRAPSRRDRGHAGGEGFVVTGARPAAASGPLELDRATILRG